MASRGEKKLRGKVTLITGGSRGIGRAVAAAYAAAGAQVFICARDRTRLDEAVAAIRTSGDIAGEAGDVAEPADAKRIVGCALAQFGTIDVLVNNASLLGPRVPIAEYPFDSWQDVIRVNLSGPLLMSQEVLRTMLAKRSGAIINVTSGVGRIGKARWGAYAVSKAGVEGFTQVLADEVKESSIRVNAVNPAATRTAMRAEAYPAEDPMTLPTPEEITPIFVYLASDDSRGVTGQSLDARDWIGREV
ncbi:MAG TPA: SDR family NAD(P)-dependent oxidoreductase [Terriglobales bacterium]|jgi:NAD(P)-dependent dehydrogenase (short-subunit alcohol dehydrogenase family)|nr:SDR family NAD(P)-dependent oxidoreductase [Terriglobales bacterium]